MTSSFSPPTDRRAAAGLLRALLDDPTADVRTLIERADTDSTYRFELICGLALSLLDWEVAGYGPAGARERFELTLLDTQCELDDDD